MSKLRAVVGILAVALLVSAASADTITTLFANNNSGSPGGGVYFDVTVGALPLEIVSYTVNSSAAAGAAIALEVFTRSGTASGFENSSVGWNLVGRGAGTAAGAGLPSAVTLDSSFVMPSGLSGMAMTLGAGAGHAYTNGNGANQHYADANVALDLGQANNLIFGAGLFSPRVWNGSITYNVIPEPATLGLLALGGLALIRRR